MKELKKALRILENSVLKSRCNNCDLGNNENSKCYEPNVSGGDVCPWIKMIHETAFMIKTEGIRKG